MGVSDTFPLNYMVLTGQINVLPTLYRRVLIPQSVYKELGALEAPETVREWRADLPGWIEIQSEQPTLDIVSSHRLHFFCQSMLFSHRLDDLFGLWRANFDE